MTLWKNHSAYDVVCLLHGDGRHLIPTGGGDNGKKPITPRWIECQKLQPTTAKLEYTDILIDRGTPPIGSIIINRPECRNAVGTEPGGMIDQLDTFSCADEVIDRERDRLKTKK